MIFKQTAYLRRFLRTIVISTAVVFHLGKPENFSFDSIEIPLCGIQHLTDFILFPNHIGGRGIHAYFTVAFNQIWVCNRRIQNGQNCSDYHLIGQLIFKSVTVVITAVPFCTAAVTAYPRQPVTAFEAVCTVSDFL